MMEAANTSESSVNYLHSTVTLEAAMFMDYDFILPFTYNFIQAFFVFLISAPSVQSTVLL
jgi:hypothetical protein